MKILLAVDDDSASFEAATVVSDWFPDDTSVVALHVGSVAPSASMTPPVAMGGLGYPIVALPMLRAERERIFLEAREVAEKAAHITGGIARAEAGDPADTIVSVAEEIDADLIVVGTGDRSWLSRVISPSVSENLVQNAPCPVLVVRPGDHTLDPEAADTAPDPEFARGADTLIGVLQQATADGFAASFQAVADAKARCSECNTESPAASFSIDQYRRLEGASDAADMMLVAFARCPACSASGTVTLGYGPNAGSADAEFLAAIDLRDISPTAE